MHWYRIVKTSDVIDRTNEGDHRYTEFIHGPDLSKLEDFAIWWWDGLLHVEWKHDHPDIAIQDFSHMTAKGSDPSIYTWSGRFNPKNSQLSIVPTGDQFKKIPAKLVRRLYQYFGDKIEINHFASLVNKTKFTLSGKNQTIKTASNITISMERYQKSIFEYLTYLAERSVVRDKMNPYPLDDAKEDATRLVRETAINMQKLQQVIQQAVSRIQNWNGSSIKIIVEKYDPSSSYNISPEDSATIEIGKPMGWGGVASFSYFGGDKPLIDDILEAGDDDFFSGNVVQSDYFNLIRELRSPGISSTPGQSKDVVLYTARPTKDKALFTNATSVPGNLFLTNDENRAFGISQEFGGRDIWAIKINTKYLTETMSAGRLKDYQITGGSTVPILGISLIYDGEQQ